MQMPCHGVAYFPLWWECAESQIIQNLFCSIYLSAQQSWIHVFFSSSDPLSQSFCSVLAVLILCFQCYKSDLKNNDTKLKNAYGV